MFKKFQALAKGGKYVYETLVPKISKNLAKKRKQQDDVIKTREKVMTEYGITNPRSRINLRTTANQPKINKKISDIYEKSEKRAGNRKQIKSLAKATIATSGAGIAATGAKIIKDKKEAGSTNPKRPGKMGGGFMGKRMGYKKGTGLIKKSNVQKIKETFGPKKNNPKMSKAKKKFPDLTGDGKVTFADILKGRGVINGKKNKRII